jgi:hypothetical protein
MGDELGEDTGPDFDEMVDDVASGGHDAGDELD